MKKVILIPSLIIFLLTGFHVQAQLKESKSQLAVEHTIFSLFSEISSKDTLHIKQNCTPDFLLLENGQVWDIDSVINKVNETGHIIRINELNFINVSVSGNNAWAAYHNTGHFTTQDNKSYDRNWLENAVLIKKHGHWIIRMMQSTRLPLPTNK